MTDAPAYCPACDVVAVPGTCCTGSAVKKLQGVQFGRAKMVHVRSSFRLNESACGMGGVQAPDLVTTTEPVNCRECLNAVAIRRPRS